MYFNDDEYDIYLEEQSSIITNDNDESIDSLFKPITPEPITPEIMSEEKELTPSIKRKYGLVVKRIHPSKLKIKKFSTNHTKPVLPSIVDLRNKLPACYDQGELGSCTANALCAAFQYDDPSFIGSRLFIYFNERSMEGTINQDAVATLSDSITILKKFGVCSEDLWPYDVSKYVSIPPLKCYVEADKHHIIEATNILNNAFSMKQCLAEGLPFIVGIQVFEAFESPEVAKTGMVSMPNLFIDECLGGHTVLVCGYDEKKQVWIVRNSWGTKWGDNGYFYLPYLYLLYPTLCSDLWYISRVQKSVARLATNNEFDDSLPEIPTTIPKHPETIVPLFQDNEPEPIPVTVPVPVPVTEPQEEINVTIKDIVEEIPVIKQAPIIEEPPRRSLFDILCSYIPFYTF